MPMARPSIAGITSPPTRLSSESVRKPCAMVPPNGVSFFARAGSTWMNWWSCVTSAKRSIMSWLTTCHCETPISSPIFPFISATEIAAFCGAFMLSPLCRRSFRMQAASSSSTHFDVASRRVLDRRELPGARRARGDPLVAHPLYPAEPVDPPRALVLLGFREPRFEIAIGLAAGPVAVFRLQRRIDDAGDMAGARENELHRCSEKSAAEEHRFRRCDVVLAGGEVVDRDIHLAEVDPHIADRHQPLRELVLEIAVAKIKRVVRRRQPRRIRIPI